MRFQLPKLDYATSEFGDFLSAESFTYHYGKHHQAYIDQTNKLIQSTPYEMESLEKIMAETKDKTFNQAAQAWNHAFFWKSITPKSETPSSELEVLIEKTFGGISQFGDQWAEKGAAQFGSGWIWLVAEKGSTSKDPKLAITTTSNAGNPMTEGHKPLLCCDVWEHAYYIDHRNARAAFLKQFVTHAAWQFASANLMKEEMPNMTQFMLVDSGWEPLKTDASAAQSTKTHGANATGKSLSS